MRIPVKHVWGNVDIHLQVVNSKERGIIPTKTGRIKEWCYKIMWEKVFVMQIRQNVLTLDPMTLLRSFSRACWKHSENQKKHVCIILAHIWGSFVMWLNIHYCIFLPQARLGEKLTPRNQVEDGYSREHDFVTIQTVANRTSYCWKMKGIFHKI